MINLLILDLLFSSISVVAWLCLCVFNLNIVLIKQGTFCFHLFLMRSSKMEYDWNQLNAILWKTLKLFSWIHLHRFKCILIGFVNLGHEMCSFSIQLTNNESDKRVSRVQRFFYLKKKQGIILIRRIAKCDSLGSATIWGSASRELKRLQLLSSIDNAILLLYYWYYHEYIQ